ncbi:MAG: Thioredoxin [Syntrophorhabdus sp. PtaB.Bin006]|nr:MAG: Thioredoxin [Syntrophorhabdus sp. PtaB.Bin006]
MMKRTGRTFSTGMSLIVALMLSLVLLVVSGETLAQTGKPAKGSPGLPRIVDVGADKCIPCKMMAPILEELKKEYAGVLDVEIVDVGKNPKAAQKYGIWFIPTQIFYDANGKELKRHRGFISKQGILDRFQELDISLKPAKKKGI